MAEAALELVKAVEANEAKRIIVPGQEQHMALIREGLVRAWLWGWITANEEVELARRRRLPRFMGSDPPELAWKGPIPANAIEWAKQREVLLGNWNRDLDSKVSAILVQGLQTGATRRELMKALAKVFPQFTKYRLENIARTETSSALTQGRLIRFTAPDSNTVAVQFVAIMDARTTPICQSRDGMIMRLDDPRLPANTPPLHYMCRSTLIPVDDWDWEDLTNGDERVLQRYFGYLKGPNAPRSLADALDGWKGAEPPLKGFGKVGEGAGPKPPKVGGGGPPRKPPKTPSVADGGEEPEDAPLKKWDNIVKFHSFVFVPPMSPERAKDIRVAQLTIKVDKNATMNLKRLWDGWQISSSSAEARELQEEWEAIKRNESSIRPILREALLASTKLIPKTIIKPVTLYRGFSLAEVSDQILAAAILGRKEALVSARTLNSWSSSRRTAENYAKGGVIAVRTFDPEAIVGGLGLSPGFGDLQKAIEEREVILTADRLSGDNSRYILELSQVTDGKWGGRTLLEYIEWLHQHKPEEVKRIMEAHGPEQANFSEKPVPFNALSYEEQVAWIKHLQAEWPETIRRQKEEKAALKAALDAVPYPRYSGEWFGARTKIENEYYDRKAKDAYKLTVAMYDDPMFGAEKVAYKEKMAALAAREEAQKQQ